MQESLPEWKEEQPHQRPGRGLVLLSVVASVSPGLACSCLVHIGLPCFRTALSPQCRLARASVVGHLQHLRLGSLLVPPLLVLEVLEPLPEDLPDLLDGLDEADEDLVVASLQHRTASGQGRADLHTSH